MTLPFMPGDTMAIEIREHTLGSKDLREFIHFPHVLFANDPAWIAPLDMEVSDRLSPKKNPFFAHGEGAAWSAWRDGKMVGRITAQIDREHLRIHNDGAGFFGFFDTIDDQEVATRLINVAEGWLKAKGMKVIRGPYSLSINEEMGCLVDGFDTPPVLMMGHNLPYQGKLIENAGLKKAQDVFAWKYLVEPPPPRAQRAWEQMTALPEVRFRSVDTKNMRKELDIILEIFNDAWRDNWGFVPATEGEIRKMAEDMSLILDPDIAFFAEVDGRPVGVVVCMPNVNEAARDIKGKLFPFGIFKLLWRLKVKKPESARLVLLGIRSELRGVKKYGPLSTAMYAELARRGLEKGNYKWAELSWTLESNHAINLGIKAMRAKVYKTYRVYERPIAG